VGGLLGLGGVWFLKAHGIALPGDVYFVDTVPVLLEWSDFWFTAGMTMVIAVLAGLWPSWEASNLRPMDIIRYT